MLLRARRWSILFLSASCFRKGLNDEYTVLWEQEFLAKDQRGMVLTFRTQMFKVI